MSSREESCIASASAMRRRRLRLGLLYALIVMQGSPAAAEEQVGSLYRLTPFTNREVWFEDGVLSNREPLRLLGLAMNGVRLADKDRFGHRISTDSGDAQVVALAVRSLSLTDVDLARRHPFEHPFKRVLMYWGCAQRPGETQKPRAFLANRDDDLRLSARLAPRPLVASGPRSVREIPHEQRLVVRDEVRLTPNASLRGSHQLSRGDRATTFRVGERGDFLEPLEITRVWVSDEEDVRIEWKRNTAATAYFVNVFIQHKNSLDVIIWTSSRVPEAGWILAQSHPGSENLELLRAEGVLMNAEADTCTVPAAVTRHAGAALVVQVHAYAGEVGTAADPGSDSIVSRIRIAPRATSSVFVRRPFRHSTTKAQDAGS